MKNVDDNQTLDMFASNPDFLAGLEPEQRDMASLEAGFMGIDLSSEETLIVLEDIIKHSLETIAFRKPGDRANKAWQFEAAWLFSGEKAPLSLEMVCKGLGHDPSIYRAEALQKIHPDFRDEALSVPASILSEDV